MPTPKDRIRQFAVPTTMGFFLFMNWWTGAVRLGGVTQGEIAFMFPTLFTPEFYVFSIWGIIYMLLIGYAVYQLVPGQSARPIHRAIGWPLTIVNVIGGAWLVTWHLLYLWWSALILAIMLALVLTVFMRLGVGRHKVSELDFIFCHLPFSIYPAWLSVALIANIAIALKQMSWSGFGISEPVWTVALMTIASLIAITVQIRYWSPAFVAVLVWAFSGIWVRNGDIAPIGTMTLLLCALLIAFVLVRGRKRLATIL